MIRPRFLRTLILIVSLTIVLIGSHSFGLLLFIEKPLGALLHNTSANIYTISIWQQDTYTPQTLREDELQKAFISLQEKYRKAVVDRAAYEQLVEDYAAVTQQMEFFSEKKWKHISARITGKHVDPFVSTVSLLVHDAETHIDIGAPAITNDGVFVGVVSEIDNNIVAVRLLNDGQIKVGASLMNEQGTVGVIEGGFGKSIRMNFIPQNENVSSGDIVVSSGLSEKIPYGLPIGTIETVEKEPYQPFQSAVVSPLIEPNRLRILSIIVEEDLRQ